MEEVVVQTQTTTVDKSGDVVLDVENLAQSWDKCSGSPKVNKALSRKGSCRIERRTNEEPEADDTSRKFVVKVIAPSLESLKQPTAPNKTHLVVTATTNNACFNDALDGKGKRFNHFTSINPRKILLLFATMSSMGTMILIYFTLAINRRGGV